MNDPSNIAQDESNEISYMTTGQDLPISLDTDSSKYQFSRALRILSNPRSTQAEEIGALRAHLLANHLRERRRSLVVCGASADVGCTQIIASIGVALALAGVRTLLIDANMRSPGLESVISPVQPVTGLRQCLEGTAYLSDSICPNVVSGLSLLYSGGISNHPQELLSSADFSALATDCMRDFDLVLVDVPPGNQCADAQIVATVLRYALVVTRKNISFLSDVKLLVRQFEDSGALVIGTFLNDA